ncbi:flagellar type III secretion system pore protein FliP [Paracraurococcus ruber]|uniref:Flagellar biosynthetic protein FliP n=1 Tax=Paracraurococcus ruber TaxID=77675 RepID=A0ABS1D791_9PROT|nr:flagellar type III secretion system pore protein FliP [Paracraurococcus ruber]MBK1662669.1 flagellar biosynthetic protein FliP [Paracraurococcus ruber]TDG06697.1 flagellar type III secretion system pore protein FliP [Paracraurococcus ruber]
MPPRPRFPRGLAAAALALLIPVLAAVPAAAQNVTLSLGAGGAAAAASGGQSLTTNLVALLVGTTLLALAPGLLVVATAFTRIVVVLSMLRTALGLQQSPPNTVIVALALFLSAFVMAPVLERVWHDAAKPLMDGAITEEQAAERAVAPFRSFMEANVRERDLTQFRDIARWTPPPVAEGAAPAPVPLHILSAAFITSELAKAFQIGFLLFLPFLAIDIAVSAVLMGMGMMMLPPVTVSLPFKLVFFVLVDGWGLVAGSLVRGFAP